MRTSDEAIRLAADIRKAWESFRAAVANNDKSFLRAAHVSAKAFDKGIDYAGAARELVKLKRYFREPGDIQPNRIRPVMCLVKPGSLEERLFKLCRAYWSMPYSKGYGRRLRYVVYDEAHESVIGIIGLHSAAADLGCRDEYLGVNKGTIEKLPLINSTLDAYTLGAVPPYAALLGGKLVTGLVAANTIRQDYWRVYGARRSVLGNARLPQPLIAVSTTSAFGRSSIYNRLRFASRELAVPIGYTKGFGTVHLEHLYPRIEQWLRAVGMHVPAGFGNGPKVRWQNVARALQTLQLPREMLQHGLVRQVFLIEHVSNLREVCVDGAVPVPLLMDAHDWSEYWLQRYALPRALRDQAWVAVNSFESMRGALTAHQLATS